MGKEKDFAFFQALAIPLRPLPSIRRVAPTSLAKILDLNESDGSILPA